MLTRSRTKASRPTLKVKGPSRSQRRGQRRAGSNSETETEATLDGWESLRDLPSLWEAYKDILDKPLIYPRPKNFEQLEEKVRAGFARFQEVWMEDHIKKAGDKNRHVQHILWEFDYKDGKVVENEAVQESKDVYRKIQPTPEEIGMVLEYTRKLRIFMQMIFSRAIKKFIRKLFIISPDEEEMSIWDNLDDVVNHYTNSPETRRLVMPDIETLQNLPSKFLEFFKAEFSIKVPGPPFPDFRQETHRIDESLLIPPFLNVGGRSLTEADISGLKNPNEALSENVMDTLLYLVSNQMLARGSNASGNFYCFEVSDTFKLFGIGRDVHENLELMNVQHHVEKTRELYKAHIKWLKTAERKMKRLDKNEDESLKEKRRLMKNFFAIFPIHLDDHYAVIAVNFADTSFQVYDPTIQNNPDEEMTLSESSYPHPYVEEMALYLKNIHQFVEQVSESDWIPLENWPSIQPFTFPEGWNMKTGRVEDSGVWALLFVEQLIEYRTEFLNLHDITDITKQREQYLSYLIDRNQGWTKPESRHMWEKMQDLTFDKDDDRGERSEEHTKTKLQIPTPFFSF